MIADREDKSGYKLRVLIHRLTQTIEARIYRLIQEFCRFPPLSISIGHSLQPGKHQPLQALLRDNIPCSLHCCFQSLQVAHPPLVLALYHLHAPAMPLYIRLRSGDCVGHLSTSIPSPPFAHIRRSFVAGGALSSFTSTIGSCLSALVNTVPVPLLFCESRLTKAITVV